MHRAYQFKGWIARVILALGLCMPWSATAQRAQVEVNIELVLALDSSASMSAEEFRLQIDGLSMAFRDPAILRAIEELQPLGAAIAVTQWGGPGESRIMVPFTEIRTTQDAKAFGFLVSRGYRSFRATTTSIATAIDDSVALLDANGFAGHRRVIDVSGDGVDNSGLDLVASRDAALALGVTVNGLAIESEHVGLTDYYRENVIIGADSFVVKAKDFEDYARAIREKLLRELRPLES
jgi:hypothetical protein